MVGVVGRGAGGMVGILLGVRTAALTFINMYIFAAQ